VFDREVAAAPESARVERIVATPVHGLDLDGAGDETGRGIGRARGRGRDTARRVLARPGEEVEKWRRERSCRLVRAGGRGEGAVAEDFKSVPPAKYGPARIDLYAQRNCGDRGAPATSIWVTQPSTVGSRPVLRNSAGFA